MKFNIKNTIFKEEKYTWKKEVKDHERACFFWKQIMGLFIKKREYLFLDDYACMIRSHAWDQNDLIG